MKNYFSKSRKLFFKTLPRARNRFIENFENEPFTLISTTPKSDFNFLSSKLTCNPSKKKFNSQFMVSQSVILENFTSIKTLHKSQKVLSTRKFQKVLHTHPS